LVSFAVIVYVTLSFVLPVFVSTWLIELPLPDEAPEIFGPPVAVQLNVAFGSLLVLVIFELSPLHKFCFGTFTVSAVHTSLNFIILETGCVSGGVVIAFIK